VWEAPEVSGDSKVLRPPLDEEVGLFLTRGSNNEDKLKVALARNRSPGVFVRGKTLDKPPSREALEFLLEIGDHLVLRRE
jgi:hypothetical protein